MKLKALLLAIAVAGFTASFALADDGGHGGHHKRGEHAATTTTTTATTTTAAANACAEVELMGTLGTVAPNSFTLTVAKQANEQDEDDNDDDNNANNAPAVGNLVGQTVTIAVGPDTRVSFKVTGALRGPATGDAAKVKAQACGTPMTLTAQSVKAQPATAAGTHASSHK